MFNIHCQKESRKETLDRAEKFVEMIVEKEEDCVIVTHGFFMHTLIDCMKKQDFQISHTRSGYSNGECVIGKR
ncbi:histidine phosphatase family protein [Hominibacterium faecale]|uniref:histidine phosphatase family protein n=1 Tax=Hominibacterium faecale TaxID=2839743 RepID=UPI003A8F1784